MYYIKFKTIEIENFQSLGSGINIDLSGRGIVLVKGENNWDTLASSNGSGKSSIFEALAWCIYGKTSAGITDTTNRYTNKECVVKLVFDIGMQEYTIIRAVKSKIYKTGLVLLKGTEDISSRIKIDTDKTIRKDIIPINQDIFLSTIFLSQGFANRISSLLPSGRKERIETLTDTATQVDKFRDEVMSVKNMYTEKLSATKSSSSYKKGSLDSIKNQINQITAEIKELEKDKPDGDKDTILSEIDTLETFRMQSKKELENLKSIEMSLKNLMYEKQTQVGLNKKELDKYLKLLADIEKPVKICPTCKQEIKKGIETSFKKQYEEEILELKENLVIINNENSVAKDKLKTIYQKIETITNKNNIIENKLSELRSLFAELSKFRDTTNDKKKVVELTEDSKAIERVLLKFESEISELDTMQSVANHCTTLIAKSFRGYLLQDIIDFMNVRLEKYSEMLFSNDVDKVNLVVDSAKLDIFLGDALYDTLSGGEKKKVDVLLVIVQRELALNIAGISSNILILDEIFENLDMVSANNALNLLSVISQEIDSMFIISHNDYIMSNDSVITVTKGVDRISTVSSL